MATGDITIFEEFVREIGEEVHQLATDTLRFGIVKVAPTAADATPRWADYVANQITTATSYTGPHTILNTDYTEAAGTATLVGDSFTIAQDAGGQTSTSAWGVVYNDTAANDEAICFFELGTIDLTAGDLVIRFNNQATGTSGDIITAT